MRAALAIGREVLGEAWAERHARDKKAALGQALEAAFAAGAASWLPPGMGVQTETLWPTLTRSAHRKRMLRTMRSRRPQPDAGPVP